jgi:hypothetical protein
MATWTQAPTPVAEFHPLPAVQSRRTPHGQRGIRVADGQPGRTRGSGVRIVARGGNVVIRAEGIQRQQARESENAKQFFIG